MSNRDDVATEASAKTAVERAEEFGVDISLLVSNLQLTPTERVIRMERALRSMLEIRAAMLKQPSSVEQS